MSEADAGEIAIYQGHFVAGTMATAHHSGLLDISTVYAGERFPGCSQAPVHLLTLDPAAFPELPDEIRALGPLQIVHTACRQCDAWLLNGAERWGSIAYELLPDGRVRPLEPERYPVKCPPGGTYRPVEQPWNVEFRLAPEGYNPLDNALTVAAEPAWLQSTPQWGICPRCRQGAFFLAQIDALRTPPRMHLQDQVLYVFVCAASRVLIVTTQLT